MKLIHLSDLHLGKRVNEFSMLEDQAYILKKILAIIDDEKPNAVLIAGDVYDKSIPPAEAVELFDDFLVRLARKKVDVFIISGNHDSPERLAFGNRLLDASGIHLSPVYDGKITPITMQDEFGDLNIYLLPFIKPVHVRRIYPEQPIETYSDAIGVVIEQMDIIPHARNVIVTHQFITGASRSDSEEISVGGTDNVNLSLFDAFDYVALGHLHGPQNIGSDRVRYSGTPLKYSFSEARHKKSVTVVELLEKGTRNVRTIPLIPKRDMVELKGSYRELTAKSFYENTSYQTDYVHITLTDEEDIPDCIRLLRTIYHNLMKLDYDNKRTRHKSQITGTEAVQHKSPYELFSEFYEAQNNMPMTEEQASFVEKLITQIWEDEQCAR